MFKKWGLVLSSLFLTLTISACGGNSALPGNGSSIDGSTGEDKELVVVDWGGARTEASKKSIYEPFEKQYGVKVISVSPTDYGKFKAMVQSGAVEWDVVNVDTDFVIRGGKEGLLEKLDYGVISKEGLIEDLVNEYGVGSDLFTTAISYNTNAYSNDNHPKNWSEFWDTNKFPGSRALWKYAPATLEAALLADGVKPEELYPLDVDRAFKSLDKIKKDIKVWWSSGAQSVQILSSKEVVLAEAWNGRISKAKADGAPIDLEFNEGLIMANNWVIPKGAPHKDLAMKFIAFALEAKQQAVFSSELDYAPVNEKALDLMSDEVKNRLGQSPEKYKTQLFINVNWWVDNYDKVNERFQQWLLAR
ncbi:ABC transporter substrate-binding protein [Brevibacillus sp. NRS-1366]|uniref:ABC transporter substrate-binding protein n=1 Tax=Brevibacillus sp. NRS-1366 TaxID=3233899 RepID=UPI003D1A8E79